MLRQVERLLDEGLAVGNKELKEYMEVRGYANAADWVYLQGVDPGEWSDASSPITLTEVRHVHKLALDLVWDVAPHPEATPSEAPGSFREHDIQPFPEGMRPPAWTEVPVVMSDWIEMTARLKHAAPLDFPEALAEVHARVQRIHPFLDGNGRTGRLLLNLLLVRLGFRRPSSTSATGRGTSARCDEPTAATSARSARCWRARRSTTCTGSSSPR